MYFFYNFRFQFSQNDRFDQTHPCLHKIITNKHGVQLDNIDFTVYI